MARFPSALFVLLVALVALSGCLDEGQESTDTPVPTPTPEDDDLPVHLPADLDEVPLPDPSQLPPPKWSEGTAWRYAVDGAWVDRPYLTTLGVVARDVDRYIIGADAVEEIAVDLEHGGLLTRGIEQDTLAVRQHGAWQPLVRFGEPSARWNIMFYGQTVDMRSFAVSELPGPGGPSPGIRTVGTAPDGHRLVVDYHHDQAAYTRIAWSRGEAVLLRYALEDAGSVAPETLTTWRVLHKVQTGTSSILPVESTAWTSDGRGDLLVMMLHADAAQVGRATIWDPQVRPAIAAVAAPDAAVHKVAAVSDQPGTWRLAATSLGTSVSISLYQVETSGPLGLTAPAKERDTGLLPIELPLPRLGPLGSVLG